MTGECPSPTKHKLPILFDPSHNLIPRLNEAQVFELQQKTTKIFKSFCKLVYLTWKYLKEIDISKVISYLMLMLSSTHNKSELKQVKDYNDLLEYLSHSISWFNYELMEELTSEFLKEEEIVISSWESYKADLKEYSNGRVEEYEGVKFGLPKSHQHKVLVLKLDPEYNDMKLTKIKELRSAICKILGKPYTLLYLVSVHCSSIILKFLIPLFGYNTLFPLSVEQEKELAKLGVAVFEDTTDEVP